MYTFNSFRDLLILFYRRAPEIHTDGLLGGCEYRRNLWGTNMSLLTQRLYTAEPTSLMVRPIIQYRSPPADRWRHTNHSAYSMDDFYRTRRRLWRLDAWNTHKIGRRVCARWGYHPLIPSLMNKVSQTTINLRSKWYINQQSSLIRFGFISTLLRMVVSMINYQSWKLQERHWYYITTF